MRLPIYSSELNAIETVWSLLKRKARSQFTKFAINRKLNKYRCMCIVEEEIKTIERDLHKPHKGTLRRHLGFVVAVGQ